MPAETLFRLNRPSTERAAHNDAAPAFEATDAGADILDLGLTRGDGVFETINVAVGRLQALEAHLARFVRSARMLDLPLPDLPTWEAAIRAAVAAHPPAHEAIVKTILTRGVEGDGRPSGWILVLDSPDYRPVREHGIRVVLLDRGYRSDVQQSSPWLLQGAKTLSYALNRAAVREAVRRGADDAVFVSSDGFLLEGPTANLVLRSGGVLRSPPARARPAAGHDAGRPLRARAVAGTARRGGSAARRRPRSGRRRLARLQRAQCGAHPGRGRRRPPRRRRPHRPDQRGTVRTLASAALSGGV